MRNNPCFLRVLTWIDNNNKTKAEVDAATDAQILGVMERPSGDHTRVDSVRACLVHVFRERKHAAQLVEMRDLVRTVFPNATAEITSDGIIHVDPGVSE